MRTYMGRAGLLLALWAVLAPGVALAQDSAGYAPPAHEIWAPLSSTQPERGGLFVGLEFLYMRQTNPITNQEVAYRGFQLVDSSALGAGSQGTFVGTHALALDVHQVSGPNGYAPGFKMDIGWKFDDESAVTFSFMQLTSVKRTASAGEVPPNGNTGGFAENSFLSSPVINATSLFSGPQKINIGDQGAVFGLWNGASEMTLEFKQWMEQYEMTYRWAVYETETYRLNGLVGPRITTIWERFRWRTVDIPFDNTTPGGFDTGLYNNILSQNMYGFHAGCEQEWYLGHGFAATLNLQGALFMDFAKERVSYQLGVEAAGGKDKRAVNQYQLVPEVESTLGLMWYPTPGIQCQIGYDLMVFFNTLASPQPISFDISGLDPKVREQTRLFDGFQASISFSF